MGRKRGSMQVKRKPEHKGETEKIKEDIGTKLEEEIIHIKGKAG